MRRMVVIGCVAAISGALLAAPAQGAGKPDLVIARSQINGAHFAFEGERNGTSIEDVTKNIGSAPAPPTLTRVYLAHGSSQVEFAHRGVPSLGAGGRSTGDSARTHAYNDPIGGYHLIICADDNNRVQESNESNNCGYLFTPALDPINFFVIKRTWSGTVGGTATSGPLNEAYHSTNAKLVLDGSKGGANDGVFTYDFAGPVTYKTSGSGGGCTWSGGDTETFGAGGATAQDDLEFDYLTRTYTGTAAVDGAFYTVTEKCGSLTYHLPGPGLGRVFLNVNRGGKPSHFEFGATHISGSNLTRGVGTQTWTWGFD